MTYYRKPEIQGKYNAYQGMQSDACPFCDPEPQRRIYKRTDSYYVTENLNPYDLWDLHKVKEHLMLIPNKHVRSLSELSAVVRAEIFNVLADYESRGFNIYARAPQNATKSVVHQHTHLIKTSGPKLMAMSYTREPYTRSITFDI